MASLLDQLNGTATADQGDPNATAPKVPQTAAVAPKQPSLLGTLTAGNAPATADPLTAMSGTINSVDPLAFSPPPLTDTQGGGAPLPPPNATLGSPFGDVGGMSPVALPSNGAPPALPGVQAQGASAAPPISADALAPQPITSTKTGTTSNAFNGLTNDAGDNAFGTPMNADASTALRALEASSGINAGTSWNAGTNSATGGDPTKFGLPANASAADIHNLALQMSAIANGDPTAIKAGLSSANPVLKQIAQSYDLGLGSAGLGGQDYATAKASSDALKAGGANPPSAVVPTDTSKLPTDPSLLALLQGGGDPGSPAPSTAPSSITPSSASPTSPSAPLSPAPLNAPTTAATGTTVAPPAGIGTTAPPATSGGTPTAVNTQPSLTPTDPNNALTAQTIGIPALADRFKIAQDQYDTSVKAGDPAYQASLRDALRAAFAGGAGGSGKLQGTLGDIQSNWMNTLANNRSNFLNTALTGTIQDAKDTAAQADQQQAFQKSQQDTGFGQAVTLQQLQDALKNSDLSRNLSTLAAGNTNDPTSLLLTLSQLFGGQGSDASKALASLIQGQAAKPTTQGGTDLSSLLKYLQGTVTPATQTSSGVDSTGAFSGNVG